MKHHSTIRKEDKLSPKEKIRLQSRDVATS
jgi:hypothetical protein